MARPHRRDTALRLRLRRSRRMCHQSGKHRRPRIQSPVPMHRARQSLRSVRAGLGQNRHRQLCPRITRSRGPIGRAHHHAGHHHAMMLAIATAARRQIPRIALHREQRRDHRQAEDEHDRDCQESPQALILAQPRTLELSLFPSMCRILSAISLSRNSRIRLPFLLLFPRHHLRQPIQHPRLRNHRRRLRRSRRSRNGSLRRTPSRRLRGARSRRPRRSRCRRGRASHCDLRHTLGSTSLRPPTSPAPPPCSEAPRGSGLAPPATVAPPSGISTHCTTKETRRFDGSIGSVCALGI